MCTKIRVHYTKIPVIRVQLYVKTLQSINWIHGIRFHIIILQHHNWVICRTVFCLVYCGLSLNSDQSQYSESNNNDNMIEYTIILNEFQNLYWQSWPQRHDQSSQARLANVATAFWRLCQVKACSDGPNNVGRTSCNNFQIVFFFCFFCKYFNAPSFNCNISYRIIKTFEKQAVEPSVSSLLNNVGPTLLGPFEQALTQRRLVSARQQRA